MLSHLVSVGAAAQPSHLWAPSVSDSLNATVFEERPCAALSLGVLLLLLVFAASHAASFAGPVDPRCSPAPSLSLTGRRRVPFRDHDCCASSFAAIHIQITDSFNGRRTTQSTL